MQLYGYEGQLYSFLRNFNKRLHVGTRPISGLKMLKQLLPTAFCHWYFVPFKKGTFYGSGYLVTGKWDRTAVPQRKCAGHRHKHSLNLAWSHYANFNGTMLFDHEKAAINVSCNQGEMGVEK